MLYMFIHPIQIVTIRENLTAATEACSEGCCAKTWSQVRVFSALAQTLNIAYNTITTWSLRLQSSHVFHTLSNDPWQLKCEYYLTYIDVVNRDTICELPQRTHFTNAPWLNSYQFKQFCSSAHGHLATNATIQALMGSFLAVAYCSDSWAIAALRDEPERPNPLPRQWTASQTLFKMSDKTPANTLCKNSLSRRYLAYTIRADIKHQSCYGITHVMLWNNMLIKHTRTLTVDRTTIVKCWLIN